MSIAKALKGMGYTCISTLGEGTYGKIKLASSKKHGRNVAIKVMDREKIPDLATRFLRRELFVTNRVHHPNIIEVLESFEVGRKYVCIVMEVAEKDLLQKIEEDKRIPEEQARTWITQMVGAVSYLHQMNVVHRDLKCENVLLTSDGRVKICDFGFGRFVRETFQSSRTFCGSAAYSPPEVLRGTPYDPKKYDVWSLGVISYVMVTGLLPYDDANIRRLVRLQESPLVFPDDVTDSCRAFLHSLLQVEASQRPSIQQVEEHPWIHNK